MKRRDFITKAGLGTAAVAGAALAAPAVAQERKVLTCVSSWGRDFPGLGVSAQRLMERITQLSEGRLTMEYFAGGEKVGALDVFDEVASGKIDFDRCISTPDMMPLVGKLGKVLGPRGMMPNPRTGTVTNDVSDAVKSSKSGAVEFRAEKGGVVHAGIGKASFSEDAISENIKEFINAVRKEKPSGAKGTYIKKISLSSTMGPGVRIDTGGV